MNKQTNFKNWRVCAFILIGIFFNVSAPLASFAHPYSFQPQVVSHTHQGPHGTQNGHIGAAGVHNNSNFAKFSKGHHHFSSNSLTPINLKSREELSNYFGLSPGVTASKPVINFSTRHYIPVNSTTSGGASVPNAQTRSIAIHRLPNSFDHAKSTALLNNAVKQNGENLNLASSRESVVWNADNVQIQVGGQTITISNGQHITPAEFAAAAQVLNGAGQTLILGSNGVSTGGTLTLTPSTMPAYNLVIPKGVTLDLVGFSATTPLVAGLVKDNGTVDIVGGGTSVIDARALIVGSSGTISDNSILDINTSRLFSNSGDITASVLNLNSNAGTFNNSGTLQATVGNVSFTTAANTNLALNNTNGQVIAAGSINFRDTNYNTASLNTANTTVNGGNLLATNAVNFNGGQGTVTADVNTVTGTVNTTAAQAHVTAATQNLIIGSTNIDGDPSYFNTAGNVTIASNLSFSGQNLAIVASGNILTASGAGIISTSSSSVNAGNITMIAGANVSSNGASSGSNDTSTTLTINGGNANGGYIDLNGSVSGSNIAITSLTSTSTNSGSNGGNINLIAYAGSNSSSGTITLPSTLTVTSGGSGSGSNGNVNIIAGATSGTGINIGNVSTTGGTGGNGNINIQTATPNLTNGMTILNGAITSGSIAAGSTQASSISIGNLTAPGAAINVISGGTINLSNNSTISAQASGTSGNGGSITITGVSITTSGVNALNASSGSTTGNGGTISLTASGATSDITVDGTSGFSLTANAGSTSGNGGTINISAGRNLTVNSSGTIDTTTSTGTGGNVNLTASANSASGVLTLNSGVTINVEPQGTGTGGTVTLVDNSQGTLTLATNVVIYAVGGLNGGSGGTISITNLGASGNNGGISFADGVNLAANINGVSGNAGSITVNAGGSTPGIINLPGTFNLGVDFDAVANGGSGNGGTITVTAAGFTGLSSQALYLAAYAGFPSGTGNGGTITVTTLSGTSTGDITVGVLPPSTGLQLDASAYGSTGNGGTINISSGNNLTVSANSFLYVGPYAGNSGNGGNINLTASTASQSGTLTYNEGTADSAGNAIGTTGQGTGNGGTVTLTNNSSGAIVMGGQIDVSGGNTSGNGGTITITNLGANGSNGGMSFADGVFLNASVSGGPGTAGNITINAGGSTPGIVALSGTLVNGVSFFVYGAGTGTQSGNGGTITITAAGFTGLLSQRLLLEAANSAGTGSGNGGTINITTLSGTSTGDIVVGAEASPNGLELDASAYGPTGNGGTVNLSSGNNLTVPVDAYLYVGPYAGTQGVQSGNGGNINLTASTVSRSGTLTYNAGTADNAGNAIGTTGQGTGNGGMVTLTNNSSGAIVVGGNIDVSGGSTSGNGGTITITNPGANGSISIGSGVNLTANATSGSGGMVSISASGGITLGGNINVGSSGTISLISTTSTIGNSSPCTLTGGTMTLSQGSGSVTVDGNNTLEMGGSSADLTLSSPTSITISTGSGFIEDAGPGSYALIANSIFLTSISGQIGTPGFRVNCTTLSANTSGNVHVNDLATSTVTLDASSAGNTTGNFTFVTTSNIIINGNVTGNIVFIATTSGASGSITVNANANVGNYSVGGNSTTSLLAYGSGFVEDSGPGSNAVQGNTVNISSLNGGQIGVPGLRVIGDTINANSSGQVHLNNIGTQPVTFTGVTGGAGLFQVLSSSAITVTGAISAPTVFLEVTSGNGGITIDSTVGLLSSTPTSTQVICNGGGTIVTGAGGLIQGSTVIVSSVLGSVGTNSSPVLIAGNSPSGVSTNSITLNAGGGLINVSNTYTGTGTVTLAGAVAGTSLNFASSGGSLIIDGATSKNGALTVVDATGSMTIASSSAISSTNGDITIQNTNTSSGSIVIGANSTLHASATTAGVGNVYVIIGAKPGSPVVGSTPANVTVNNTGGGITYFGSNSITASAPTNTLNASGRNIVFNTGSLPSSAISLGGGITITADPPVEVSNQTVSVSGLTNSSHISNTIPGQEMGQNLNYVAMYNSALTVEPVSAGNSTAGITNTSVQSLINNAAVDTIILDKKLNQATIEYSNSK